MENHIQWTLCMKTFAYIRLSCFLVLVVVVGQAVLVAQAVRAVVAALVVPAVLVARAVVVALADFLDLVVALVDLAGFVCYLVLVAVQVGLAVMVDFLDYFVPDLVVLADRVDRYHRHFRIDHFLRHLDYHDYLVLLEVVGLR